MEPMNELTPLPDQQPLPTPDPQMALATAVARYTQGGWRAESYGPAQVTMVRGRRPNHILHLLLSVFTLGLWLLVWLIVGLTAREHRTVLAVDQSGRVQDAAMLQQAGVGSGDDDWHPWSDPGVIVLLVILAVTIVWAVTGLG